jgi:hypothetical protein
MFYYSQRRGWYLALDWVTIEMIEERRLKGASFFVVFGEDAGRLRSNTVLLEKLQSAFPPLVSRSDLMVFDLRKRPDS